MVLKEGHHSVLLGQMTCHYLLLRLSLSNSSVSRSSMDDVRCIFTPLRLMVKQSESLKGLVRGCKMAVSAGTAASGFVIMNHRRSLKSLVKVTLVNPHGCTRLGAAPQGRFQNKSIPLEAGSLNRHAPMDLPSLGRVSLQNCSVHTLPSTLQDSQMSPGNHVCVKLGLHGLGAA